MANELDLWLTDPPDYEAEQMAALDALNDYLSSLQWEEWLRGAVASPPSFDDANLSVPQIPVAEQPRALAAVTAIRQHPTLKDAIIVGRADGTVSVQRADGSPMTSDEQSWLERTLTGLGTAATPILLTLGLGAAGIGISQALSPGPATLTLPEPQKNPIVEAGQRAALETIFGPTGGTPLDAMRTAFLTGQVPADQALAALRQAGVADPEGTLASWATGGGLTGLDAVRAAVNASVGGQAELAQAGQAAAARERLYDVQEAPQRTFARQIALSQVPALLAAPEPADPIGAAYVDRIMKAIRGEEVDPTLERQLRDQKQLLLDRLARMYGRPGQDIEGTVGQNLALEFDKRANELRYGINRDILATLAPQEMTRRTFAAGQRTQRLGEATALANFGRANPSTLQANLSGVAPIAPMLGITDTTEAATSAANTNAVAASFAAEQAAAQRRADAIAGIFGRAAAAGVNASRPSFAGILDLTGATVG